MEQQEHHKQSMLKEAFQKWLGLFLVIVASLFIFLLIDNMSTIGSIFSSFAGILKPVIYGCVIAYILNPMMKHFKKLLENLWQKCGKELTKKTENLIDGIAITISIILGLVIVVVLCWMILPQLIETISSLVQTLPGKANLYYDKLAKAIRNNQFLADKMQDFALDFTDSMGEILTTKLLPWLQDDLLPGMNTVAVGFANGLFSILNLLYTLFIGIIVAIYILGSKKRFAAQAKKILYGILSKKSVDVVIHYARITDRMFSGFIAGKIVDSTIVGFICFVLMSLFGMPYAMLISVFIGVTNIIPVFGPYIGLVPSTLLILLVNPMQALYFVIMIAVLQQIDGNILGPAILGESTGLSGFWVLFSILFFGGIWGIVGMIVGVPLFAVIYRIVGDFINRCLRKKELSIDIEKYENLQFIEIQGDEIYYIKQDETAQRLEAQRIRQEKRAKTKEKYQKLKNRVFQKKTQK